MNTSKNSLLMTLFSLILMIVNFGLIPSKVVAQTGQNNSQESIDQVDQELEQDATTLEEEQSEELRTQQEEQKLEQELNIQEKNPQSLEIESVPAPGVGDNVPTPPPLGEREIKIPE